MIVIEWLELAKEAIMATDDIRAIKYINEAIEVLKESNEH